MPPAIFEEEPGIAIIKAEVQSYKAVETTYDTIATAGAVLGTCAGTPGPRTHRLGACASIRELCGESVES